MRRLVDGDDMNSWMAPAVACLVMWGLSRFFPKLATNHLDPKSAFIYEIAGEMIIALGFLFAIGFKPAFDLRGTSFALIAGLFGGLGVYFYLLAAQRGNVSQLVIVSALYPIITVLLGVTFLQESINFKQGLGVGFGLLAIILVTT